MQPRNRGHAALLRLDNGHGWKARVARDIGAQPNQITQWVEDGINPSGPNRTKFEAIGIGSTWWDEPYDAERDGEFPTEATPSVGAAE